LNASDRVNSYTCSCFLVVYMPMAKKKRIALLLYKVGVNS
jgi:hypothetical protein